MARRWRLSVLDAIERLSNRSQGNVVTRQQLIQNELPTIIKETQSEGKTPEYTLSYELQQLRDSGLLDFLDPGRYRLTRLVVDAETFGGTQDELDSAINEGRLRIGRIEADTALALQRRRIGQQRLRLLALENYEGTCALCDIQDEDMLVTSRIAPWAESEDGRGDLANVIILCRPHDSLFERGYWSLDEKLRVLRHTGQESPWVVRSLLREGISFRRPHCHPPANEYVTIHRIRFGFEAQARVPQEPA